MDYLSLKHFHMTCAAFATAWVATKATFGYIVAVAVTKNPLVFS